MNTPMHYDQYINNNHASLGMFINRLFEHRSRILVVRIDLSYLKEYSQSVSLEMAQEHREQLLDYRWRDHHLFDRLLGYAWSLEHGSCNYDGMGGTGFHHHFIFFYDGSFRQEDISIGVGLANLWKDVITNHIGHCYISNFDKKKLEQMGCLGIGMIHRNDSALRNNLLKHVAGYLVKGSPMHDVQSARSETGDFRIFGRSWILPALPEDQPRRGRPPVQRKEG